MKQFIFYLLAAISINSCAQHSNEKISVITPQEFSEKSENNIVIDARTKEEFNKGHLKNAINIDYLDKNYAEKLKVFNKKKPIFIYCRSGRRSNSMAHELEKLGFEKIYDLKGGILNWETKKLDIVQ